MCVPILVNMPIYHTDGLVKHLRITVTLPSYASLPNSQNFHELIYLFFHTYVYLSRERSIVGLREKGDHHTVTVLKCVIHCNEKGPS